MDELVQQAKERLEHDDRVPLKLESTFHTILKPGADDGARATPKEQSYAKDKAEFMDKWVQEAVRSDIIRPARAATCVSQPAS